MYPFGNLNNQNFNSFIYENSQISELYVGKYTIDNSILTLNPPPNFKLLSNLFDDLIAESNKKNPENFFVGKILILMKSKSWKLNQIHFFYST